MHVHAQVHPHAFLPLVRDGSTPETMVADPPLSRLVVVIAKAMTFDGLVPDALKI